MNSYKEGEKRAYYDRLAKHQADLVNYQEELQIIGTPWIGTSGLVLTVGQKENSYLYGLLSQLLASGIMPIEYSRVNTQGTLCGFILAASA